MGQYKRISKGLNNYQLYPVDFNIENILEDESNDYYESIYTYDDKHYETWKQTKTVSGILDVKTNKIVFDLDDEANIAFAQEETRTVVNRLKTSGIKPEIYFSGGKGFHVQFTIDQNIERKEFEDIVLTVGKDLKTLDKRVKDQQRLLRIPFTKNLKTGLYKIPLTEEQLNTLSVDQIKNKAKNRTLEDWELYQSWTARVQQKPKVDLPKQEKPKEVQKTVSAVGNFTEELDLSKKPKWLSPARYALQEGFFIQGERNEAFMILCSTYKSQGFPKELSWRMLKGVAELQAKRTNMAEYDPQDLWKQVVEVVYSPHWRGGIYSETEENLLKTTASRFNLVPDENVQKKRLTSFEEDLQDFEGYAKNFSQNRILTGIPEIDKSIVIAREMVIGILGAPGSGKSSVAYNICRNLSRNGKKVLFESLDMSKRQMLAKSILTHLDGKYDFLTMLQKIEQGGLSQFDRAVKEARTDRQNITFNSRASGVEEIENDIKEFTMFHGETPALVVIDYFEKIRGPYGDPQRDAHHIIPRLTDLAKEYNTCIILLLQPQKSAGDMNEELNSMRNIKGASVIEQDLRLVFTLWRPGANKDNKALDKYLQMSVVKNNLGPLDRFKFHWDGKTGNIRSLTSEERSDLEELIELNKEEKDKKSSEKKGFGF